MFADMTRLLDGKAGPAHARGQITLELRDGDRLITKFAVDTRGFNDAVKKAGALSRSISDMLAANKCRVPNLPFPF